MEKQYDCLNDIDRSNFNPVSVMIAIDKLDASETKRLLEEACYCIANARNEISGHLLAEREILESLNRVMSVNIPDRT